MMDTSQFGCLVMVGLVMMALIVLPLAALKHQNDTMQTRIEALEKP